MSAYSAIWLTGLSSVGKSTTASLLAERLRSTGSPVVVLDGDEMRSALPDRYGHSTPERIRLGMYYVDLAKLIADQGVTVVVATVSLLEDVHIHRRRVFGDQCLDVVLRAPLRALRERDTRGVYKSASSEVVGLGQVAHFPECDFLEFSNEKPEDPTIIAREVSRKFLSNVSSSDDQRRAS
ncbi:adenylyl-sulfate kinase [Brachybacterium sp. ACRRE]|uniref:adenylyl-sulfate kinase n=1 Tax=Brachybacterium sp. ACRRE TaxID=2918184 RepID=UPI00351D81E0